MPPSADETTTTATKRPNEETATAEEGDETAKKPKTDQADETAADNATATTKDDAGDDCDTKGYGKLILFGEHFVVYKVPAYVGAVAAYTDCEMELLLDDKDKTDAPTLEIIDNRPAVPDYKVKKADEAKEAISLVLKHFGLQDRSVKLVFGGNLTAVSGIGASAAQVVAMARAVKKTVPEFANLTEDEINAAGYEGEKGYHGTPSGIDNTAATFGGLLKFQRTEGDPIFTKKSLKEPIKIVYASTGITSSTTTVVGDVRAKKEADPAWFDDLMAKYVALAEKGEKALEDGDVPTLGQLMDENHALLQELTVSCKELDDLVDAARKAGAVGAKMSGTGRGGLMLALTPSDEIQNAVAEALEKAGAPQVWKTSFQ